MLSTAVFVSAHTYACACVYVCVWCLCSESRNSQEVGHILPPFPTTHKFPISEVDTTMEKKRHTELSKANKKTLTPVILVNTEKELFSANRSLNKLQRRIRISASKSLPLGFDNKDFIFLPKANILRISFLLRILKDIKILYI